VQNKVENILSAFVVNVVEYPNNHKCFTLKCKLDKPFKPGQFITVIHPNGKIRRAYSICSEPSNHQFSILVKKIDNGIVSRWLHDDILPGSRIEILPPSGKFVLSAVQKPKQIVLVAAGTGISPIMSILLQSVQDKEIEHILLIYSSRDQSHTIFNAQIESLALQHAHKLKVENFWSNSKNLIRARLNSSALIATVENYAFADKTKTLFFICGPFDYLLMARLTLAGMGYDAAQIKRETFFIPPPEADDDAENDNELVRQQATFTISLLHKGLEYKLEVEPGKRILDVALEKGISLAYSCKSGMCSTCIAQCNTGSVGMNYNEVLTQQEIEKGRVLLCQSYPLSNDVVIVV
jgi:ring-1,2-phenylacetyl-CoA epoxidase subunit PaaE